jgi:hypothetical protein
MKHRRTASSPFQEKKSQMLWKLKEKKDVKIKEWYVSDVFSSFFISYLFSNLNS